MWLIDPHIFPVRVSSDICIPEQGFLYSRNFFIHVHNLPISINIIQKFLNVFYCRFMLFDDS